MASLARTHPLDTPVPTCGDWTLADLVWHLAEVHGFWAHVIETRPDTPAGYEAPARPDATLLADLLDANCARLVTLLDDADPLDTAWSWADDHTVGFTVRRQIHEAIVHHVDALLAVGAPLVDVPPHVAADGVDELVTVMLCGVPAWAADHPIASTIRLVAEDADRTWHLEFGRMTGTSPDSGRSDHRTALRQLDSLDRPTTTVTGRALDLELWMWGRGPVDALAISGDNDGAARLRVTVVEVTQ